MSAAPWSVERAAVQRIVDEAIALGVEVPAEVSAYLCGGRGSAGSRAWVAANPGVEPDPCCGESFDGGPEDCTCWVAVYDLEQQPPRVVAGDQLAVQPLMCGDCAYRPGSPELADEWQAEDLLALPTRADKRFFCHQGIRRPREWRHPDGRVVAGDPADYQPAMRAGIAYQASGEPALLCAGWDARRRAHLAALERVAAADS